MTLDELVERAVFLANSLDRSVHPDADVISAMASQLLAMKGALEHFIDIIDGTEKTGFEPSVEQMLIDAAEDARPFLSPTKSAADKIAEGLRDAIAMSNASRGG
jgi:hypothetical protein